MHNQTNENQRLVELLARVARHDHAAFAQLYQLTRRHLLGVAVRLMRNREVAEEILQDAFINVWQQAGRYASGMSSPMTWLIFIVRNKGLDQLRNSRRAADYGAMESMQYDADGGEASDEGDPEAQCIASLDAVVLNHCLGMLDPPQRHSLTLAYFGGMSHAEVAAHLHVPLGTAKAWMRRGLERLRKTMEAASYSRAA